MKSEQLAAEKEWFENNLQYLMTTHKGQWAVVFNKELVGIFGSFQEAYNRGIQDTGTENIFIRQITEKNEPLDSSINLYLGLLSAPIYS